MAKRSKVSNVWVSSDVGLDGRIYVNATIFRLNHFGENLGSKYYSCHSENDKERRARFLWRAMRLQAAYFDKGD